MLEEQALERQLRETSFLPTTKEDKAAYSLSEAERRTPTFREPARNDTGDCRRIRGRERRAGGADAVGRWRTGKRAGRRIALLCRPQTRGSHMWAGMRIWWARALGCLTVCAVAVALPLGSSAQAPDSASDELTEAILRYTFRYDGGNIRLLRDRVPDDLGPNFHLPQGARVLGAVVMGSGVLVVATSTAPPDSLRREYTRVLEARGWKLLGSMRRGGFVEDVPQTPLTLCREGAHLQVISSRRTPAWTDLFLLYRDGTGPCERPRAVAVHSTEPQFPTLSEPQFPTLFAPPGPTEGRTRCFSQRTGGRSSMRTQTRIPADISAEQVLRHYARQIEAEGWRPRASSGLATAVGTWARTDSTGTHELKLEVRAMAGTPGVRCYEVDMNVLGDRR
jgi:hypothetical protein